MKSSSLTVGLLSELAIDFETHQAIVVAGGIPALVDQTIKGGTATKENATRAPWRLAANETNRLVIEREGCSSAVFELFADCNDDQKTSSIGLLRELAQEEDIEVVIRNPLGVVELLRSGTISQKEHATIALRELTKTSQYSQAWVIKVGGPRALVALIQDVDFRQRGAAAQTIENLAGTYAHNHPWYRGQLEAAHCGPPVVALLRDSDVDQQVALCHTLERLTLTAYSGYAIKQAGGVKLLLELLSCEDPRLPISALCALQHLEFQFDEIASAMPHIVALISPDLVALRAVANIVRKLSHSSCRAEIARLGGADRLVALLEDGADDVKLEALWMLRHIGDRVHLWSGVSALVKLVESSTWGHSVAALNILERMASNDNRIGTNCAAIVEAGGIPVLMEMLAVDSYDVTSLVVRVLSKISSYEGNVTTIVELDAIPKTDCGCQVKKRRC